MHSRREDRRSTKAGLSSGKLTPDVDYPSDAAVCVNQRCRVLTDKKTLVATSVASSQNFDSEVGLNQRYQDWVVGCGCWFYLLLVCLTTTVSFGVFKC